MGTAPDVDKPGAEGSVLNRCSRLLTTNHIHLLTMFFIKQIKMPVSVINSVSSVNIFSSDPIFIATLLFKTC